MAEKEAQVAHHHHEQVITKNAQRVDDQREKQTCPSEKNDGLDQLSKGKRVSENEGKKRKLQDQGKRPKLGTSSLSAGNKHKNRHIGAVNGASTSSRNSQGDHSRADASPNTANVYKSPYLRPLQMEMERILKEKERDTKLLEDLKLHLKSEMEYEIDSIRKYDFLHQIAEIGSAQQQKDLDTMYDKVRMNMLLAEATIQVHDTTGIDGPLQTTLGRTITGTGQSSLNRPNSVPVVTPSISEPVNLEKRAADTQISSDNFPMAANPSSNAELPRVEESIVVPQTSARATLQTASSSADLPISGSHAIPTPNYQPVILAPRQPRFQMAAIPSLNAELPRVEESAVVPQTRARAYSRTASSADLQASGSHATPAPNYQSFIVTPSQQRSQMAAIPQLNAELPRVEEPAVVPRTSAWATLQRAFSAVLPASGSHAASTSNHQSISLTPSQPSVQAGPGAGSEQRRPAPHLRPFRPMPTTKNDRPL